jgi:hypothetical protein
MIDQGEHAMVLGVKLLIADREALTPRQRVEQGAPNDELLHATVAVERFLPSRTAGLTYP